MMKIAAVLLILVLFSCASKSRLLSDEERARLGLTGIAYDIPLCPMEYDPKAKASKVTGPCEVVTCEMENRKLECRALPETKH